MSTTSMPAPRLSPSNRSDPVLLNPHRLTRRYRDDRSAELMGQTVEFFEKRGKVALKRDEHDRVWPADFLDFLRRERIFATMLTPAGYGRDDCRWDTYRISEFAEILGFYGLPYWWRAGDYMRTATGEDRQYLLYNPLVKARVTSEGERVLTDLWDVIAARGVEKDTFFEAASRDIRWLPRLEGTVHVNTALMVKFMPNYLFAPDESLPQIGVADEPVNDDYLFDQGPTRGLGKIKFRDYRPALDGFAAIPNVAVFRAQVDAFVALVAGAPPTTEQQDEIDFSLAVGQLFALLVYTGLVLEAVPAWGVADELLDEMFSVFVRDFNGYATDLLGKTSTTSEQAELARAILRQPAADPARSNHVWQKHVFVHKDIYEMNA